MTRKSLVIGLLLDDLNVDEWMYASLEPLVQSSAVERVILLVDENGPNRPVVAPAYRFFEALDVRLSRKLIHRDALVKRDIAGLLPEARCYSFRSLPDRGYHQGIRCHRMPERDRDAILNMHLDILVSLGSTQWTAEVASCARLGLWIYQWGDGARVQGGPAGFREWLEKIPVTGARLERLDGAGRVETLGQFTSTTYFYSPRVNRNLLCWSASALLAREIEKLHRLGEQRYFAEVEKNNPPVKFYAFPEYRIPALPGMLRALTIYFLRITAKALRDRLLWEKWHLFINHMPESAAQISRYQEIVAPPDEYWADPFLWRQDNGVYVFLEVFCRKRQKGHLAVAALRDDGTLTRPVTILDAPYHLSYPCLIEYQGMLYMIPESKDNHAVSLYRCVEFPHRWEWVMHLMEGVSAVDATPFFHEGRWWLFMTVVDVVGARARENLCLFYADELLTQQWTPHPLNPVVTDTRYARPAGHLVRQGTRIFRPAQDCSNTYGHAIAFREIKTLGVDAYEEVACESLVPFWAPGVVGVHTFARLGDLTVIDACRRVFNHPRLQALVERWYRFTAQ